MLLAVEKVFWYTKDIEYKDFEQNEALLDAVVNNYEVLAQKFAKFNNKGV